MRIAAIGLSGMQAAQAQLSSAAHNVANAQTPGFRRQLVQQESLPQGGTQVRLASATVTESDLAADLVAQKQALYAYKANLRSVQTENEMIGSLLNDRA
ncbi:MAG: flagellar basal body protein [Pseudomonadota bacterium]